MKQVMILTLLMLTSCAPIVTDTLAPAPTETASSPTDIPAAQTESATPASTAESTPDIFSSLPAPSCSKATPENQEGPYYTPDTPERSSLLEDGMQGDKLIIIGYVLDANCQPVPNAWLDFWQTDANGEYDNEGYTLRGHQFTDGQGRYSLETIMPGIYSSRPIRHIHVKAQVPNGGVLTTQLYFPEQPIDGLTVDLRKQENYYLAIFNFVIEQ